MFEHYPISGVIQQISTEQARQLMNTISPQWEDESTKFGKLYMGVYDWAFSSSENGIELHIPNLAGGGKIPLNTIATQKFGFDIFGDCFLKI